MEVANTQAYCNNVTITARKKFYSTGHMLKYNYDRKKFIAQAPGVNYIDKKFYKIGPCWLISASFSAGFWTFGPAGSGFNLIRIIRIHFRIEIRISPTNNDLVEIRFEESF